MCVSLERAPLHTRATAAAGSSAERGRWWWWSERRRTVTSLPPSLARRVIAIPADLSLPPLPPSPHPPDDPLASRASLKRRRRAKVSCTTSNSTSRRYQCGTGALQDFDRVCCRALP